MKKLYKIEEEGKIFGVCAGLARYFNVDVTLIRLVWLLAVILGIGSPILIYIIVAIVLPKYDPSAVDFEDVYDDEPTDESKDEPKDEYDTEDRY